MCDATHPEHGQCVVEEARHLFHQARVGPGAYEAWRNEAVVIPMVVAPSGRRSPRPPINTPEQNQKLLDAANAATGRGDVGKVGADHPATSHRAAESVDTTSQKGRLLALVEGAGRSGITCYDASKIMGISPNQIATRMMELRQANLVVRTEMVRDTTPGNTGHVHVLTSLQGDHHGSRSLHPERLDQPAR